MSKVKENNMLLDILCDSYDIKRTLPKEILSAPKDAVAGLFLCLKLFDLLQMTCNIKKYLRPSNSYD